MDVERLQEALKGGGAGLPGRRGGGYPEVREGQAAGLAGEGEEGAGPGPLGIRSRVRAPGGRWEGGRAATPRPSVGGGRKGREGKGWCGAGGGMETVSPFGAPHTWLNPEGPGQWGSCPVCLAVPVGAGRSLTTPGALTCRPTPPALSSSLLSSSSPPPAL